jgi:hypothetical protein
VSSRVRTKKLGSGETGKLGSLEAWRPGGWAARELKVENKEFTAPMK